MPGPTWLPDLVAGVEEEGLPSLATLTRAEVRTLAGVVRNIPADDHRRTTSSLVGIWQRELFALRHRTTGCSSVPWSGGQGERRIGPPLNSPGFQEAVQRRMARRAAEKRQGRPR